MQLVAFSPEICDICLCQRLAFISNINVSGSELAERFISNINVSLFFREINYWVINYPTESSTMFYSVYLRYVKASHC